ncbi:two-component sensor histidine kinase [Dactylosporangium vinaceum]|uniref:histidine kinase n=1 Tax=Dactylosporangium vinaceum TaxID=53362 RepID=A0ABV5M864_9ACTN|nr:histidine kinase [Dactylosporangium vinaceum]UAB94311.1 two-component sensor histidine kinase [Dactylosporangium vinaceum]
MRSRLFDAAGVACVLALLYLERHLAPVPILVIGTAMALCLLLRRAYPVPVAAAVYGLAVVQVAVRPAVRMVDVCVLIAMYSVVKYHRRLLWGIVAGGGAAAGVLIAALVEWRSDTGSFWTVFSVVGAVTATVWASAYSVRTRRLYIASLEEERDQLARLMAADERAAIARELHDVIAHSLSVMIVQADGAAYVVQTSPAEARQALDTIAATGRAALTDMRRVLAVLRGPSAVVEERRRPRLADLAESGLALRIEGSAGELGAAEELTVFRIVQESMTNTLRHAGAGASLLVRLERSDGTLAITATDDGPGSVAGAEGHGLIGMRERVAMHGGTFAAGPVDGGGWQVRATIPVSG